MQAVSSTIPLALSTAGVSQCGPTGCFLPTVQAHNPDLAIQLLLGSDGCALSRHSSGTAQEWSPPPAWPPGMRRARSKRNGCIKIGNTPKLWFFSPPVGVPSTPQRKGSPPRRTRPAGKTPAANVRSATGRHSVWINPRRPGAAKRWPSLSSRLYPCCTNPNARLLRVPTKKCVFKGNQKETGHLGSSPINISRQVRGSLKIALQPLVPKGQGLGSRGHLRSLTADIRLSEASVRPGQHRGNRRAELGVSLFGFQGPGVPFREPLRLSLL